MKSLALLLALPGIVACGSKPGSQPKKVATENGPAGQAGPSIPNPAPGQGQGPGSGNPGNLGGALGAASGKYLVYHLFHSPQMAPGEAPEQELRIIPLGGGRLKILLADFKTHGVEEQIFHLSAGAASDQVNSDVLEAIAEDGKKLIPVGSIRFDGRKAGPQEMGTVWIDFRGDANWIRDQWTYVAVESMNGSGPAQPPGNPGQPPGHPGQPPGHPGQGGPTQGNPVAPPVVDPIAQRALPLRGVAGQPVKVYPLVRNLGSHICQAKLTLDPTQDAKVFLMNLQSEPCGGFEIKSWVNVPVKWLSSANSAYSNQDVFETIDGQLKIEFQGSGFEYVFGPGPNGTGAYDSETGTVQIGGALFTYDTGRVLKRGQFPR